MTLGNQPDSGFASTSLRRAPIRSAFAQYRFVFGSYGPLIRPSLTMASHMSLPVRGICYFPFLASQCYEPSAPRTRIIQPEAFGQTGDTSRKDSPRRHKSQAELKYQIMTTLLQVLEESKRSQLAVGHFNFSDLASFTTIV